MGCLTTSDTLHKTDSKRLTETMVYRLEIILTGLIFAEFIPGSCGGEIHINDENSERSLGFEIVSPGFAGAAQNLDYTPGDGYDNNMHCVWKVIADQNPQVLTVQKYFKEVLQCKILESSENLKK